MIAYEIFCCSGGMAEGFRRAGIAFDLVVDADPYACASYAANLGHEPLQMDVRTVADLALPSPDLFVADPPCTPWSTAGKGRGLDDPRDCLLPTRDLILALRPHAWCVANVPGLELRRAEKAREIAFGPLRAGGWCVDYASFDAADYGVPQRRHRPFWFGHALGTPCLVWPRPTHARPEHAEGLGLLPWVTCRDALADLPAHLLGRPVRLRWHNGTDHRASAADAPARTLTRNVNGDGALLSCRADIGQHQPSALDRPARTLTSREARGAAVVVEDARHRVSRADQPSRTIKNNGGRASLGASMLTWPWDQPATVVHSDPRIAAHGHHDSAYMSVQNAIVLSEEAAKRLQGFPHGWVTYGTSKRGRWSLIGQAMPPPLAHAVATSIAAWFAENGRGA